MGQVRTTFTSEDKDVQSALDRMTKSLQKYIDENRRLKEQSKEASKEAKGQFEEIADGLTKAAAKYGPLIALAADYNAKLERQIQLHQQAASVASGLAAPQENLLLNLGNQPRAVKNQILGRVGSIADKYGLSEKDVTARVMSSVSGTGAEDYKRALEAVDLSTKMTRDPQQGQALARAIGGVQKAGKFTAEQAGGFIQRVQGMSPIANLAEIATNLPPAMENLMAAGFTPAQAGALWSQTASAMGDIHGPESTTAVIALADQLQKAAPNKSPAETFQKLLQNPAQAKAFLQKASFPAKAGAPFKSLLTGGDRFREFSAAERALAAPGAAEELMSSIADNAAAGVQPIEHVGGQLGRANEKAFLANKSGAMAAKVRESLETALTQADISPTWFGMESVPLLGMPLGEKGVRMRDFDLKVRRGVPATEAAASVVEGQLRDPSLSDQNAEPLRDLLAELKEQTASLKRIENNQRRPVTTEANRE